MSGVLSYLTHQLQGLDRLLGGDQSGQPSNTSSSGTASSSVSAPVTAGSVQNRASSSKGTPSSTTATPQGGVGGAPVTEQATPMTLTLNKPQYFYGAPSSAANSTAKTTAHTISVPADGTHPAPLLQSDQGWMLFGAAWYWWAILVSAVVIAAILVNRAFETHKREVSIFKLILRL